MPALTRSQRSKPSKRRGEDEEEMPPPPAVVELPRTRSTRSKKVSKQAGKEELVEVPKSPTSSTRSTRSRAKPKAKVATPVEEEEIPIASPPPSSTRSTRSTKQKGTGVGKNRKASSAAGKKEQKNEFSGKEIERAQVEKKLTLEQLHKQHVVPLKSALNVAVCDMFPKFMAKLNDLVRKVKSESEFEKLMSLTERAQMPPPVGPTPKAKDTTRKRARSPEKMPATTTTVPDSFAFAENSEELVPSKKKILVDQPTPVKQDLSDLSFFERSETETEDAAGASAAQSSDEGNKPEVVDLDKTHSISPKHQDFLDKPTTTSCADLNSTYVLPAAKKVNASSSAMNVTVCVKKSSNPDAEVKPKSDLLKPIVPPSFCQQNQTSRFDLSASRTFCKEPPSLAMVVEEEDEQQRKESLKAAKEKEKSEKMRLMPNTKPSFKEKDKTKGSTSSSSSNSSMKSASSQPCLITKKLPTSATKNGPNYGSAPRLHEIVKPKQFDLEEAERRRQEILQLKAEKNKKKLDEWKKKTEQHKLEEEKRLKEKQKIIQSASASSILKKAVPLGVGKPAAEPSVGFVKPKYVLGPSTTKMGGAPTMPPPLSKNLYKPPPPAPIEVDLDDSFKSAHNASSLLDQTTEGHLSSYDITMYEDLDEDLKHRENKSLPSWATDKESLKAALFSMVLLPEYKDKLPDGFPKADKSYKLFPNVMGKR